MNEDTEGVIQNGTLNTFFLSWRTCKNNDSKYSLVNSGSVTQGFIKCEL